MVSKMYDFFFRVLFLIVTERKFLITFKVCIIFNLLHLCFRHLILTQIICFLCILFIYLVIYFCERIEISCSEKITFRKVRKVFPFKINRALTFNLKNVAFLNNSGFNFYSSDWQIIVKNNINKIQ